MKKIVILDAKTMGEFNFNKLSEIGELETYELSLIHI